MSKHLLRGFFAVFVCACALALTLSRPNSYRVAFAAPTPTPTPVASASATPTPNSYTAPGTQITNAASATYTDTNNITYNTQSNTVTVTVQNAPSLVILTNNGSSTGAILSNGLRPASSPVPGNYITDIYTLVNTGNATGNFVLATAAQASPTPLPGTNSGTTTNGLESNVTYTLTCGTSLNDTQSTLAAINTDLGLAACNTTANGSVNLAVNYQANAAGNAISQVEAQIVYSGTGTGYNGASSLWVTNTYTDPIVADERIDIYKSPNPIATDGTVTYGIYVNNAGNSPANYINEYGATCSAPVTVCGSALAGPGILITDKVPVGTGGGATPLPVVSMAPSSGTGLSSGETPVMVYTTDTTAKTGWTTYSGGGVPAGAAYVGIWLSGNASGVGLLANPTPNPSSTPGYVPSAASEVGFSVKIGPMPAGTSIPNYITAPVGDNKQCIEGPGLTTSATSCDTSGYNPPSPGPTSSPGYPATPLASAPPASGTPPPGGSNTAIVTLASLLNGPNGQPDAAGCFNQTTTAAAFPVFSPNPLPTISPTSEPTCAGTDNSDDYTQAVATPNPAGSVTIYGSPAPSGLIASVSGQVKNPSGTAASIQLSFPYVTSDGSSNPYLTVSSVKAGVCPGGAALTTLSAGVYDLGSVGAGSTVGYCVSYSTVASPAAYLFQPLFVKVRAALESSPTIYYNDTWNVIMPGGFEELVKTANMLSNGNCVGSFTGGLPALGVCPGGIIQYAVMYYDTLPSTDGGTGSPAEPASATLGFNSSLVVTENGAATGNNWSTYTGGLYDPSNPASVLGAGTYTLAQMQAGCGVTTQYCGDTSANATFGQVGGAGGNVLNSTKFTDTIPSTDTNLKAQHYGVLLFSTQVK